MPRNDREPETRQEAQVRLIREAYGDQIEPGPEDWHETGIQFFVRKEFVMVADEVATRAVEILRRSDRLPPEDDDRPSEPRMAPLTRDRTRDETDEPMDGDVWDGMRWIRLREGVSVLETVRLLRPALGDENVAPELLLHVSPSTGGCCPADEPTPVTSGSPVDPPICPDRGAGAGIRVVVLDTGFDHRAAGLSWLTGVTGDPDLGIKNGKLDPYAGHGTFIAGLIRAMAPAAEVIVRRAFRPLGVVFERDLVRELREALRDDQPDVISLSAGTTADTANGPRLLNRFHDRTLRRNKGVVIVAAAGNDSRRKQFWPAASPWAVGVGALAPGGRVRAEFSNFGGWVDVFAPGQHLVNAFPAGTFVYQEPPRKGSSATFHSLASWSGTSFATPVVAGLIAARMSRTGENGRRAADALLAHARRAAIPGVGAVLQPGDCAAAACCCRPGERDAGHRPGCC